MTFQSYEFILLFLPAVTAGYYVCSAIGKKGLPDFFLLVVSVLFYLCAGREALFVLTGSIVLNYVLYRGMLLCADRYGTEKKRYLLCLGILCNLIILGYFKYYNFFVDSANLFLNHKLAVREIMLPVGISFITFQQIAFLTDAYRQEIAACSFGEYALFVTFFPHIWSGPILTFRDFYPLLHTERKMDWDKLASGLYLFVMGLGKKVLIADLFGGAVDWGYENLSALNAASMLFVSFSYTIQIYFDFSGYSDMAVGISRMLMLDLPVNFQSPYQAETIMEFWKRWHMTLTGFFTKYLYIPLGGNRRGGVRTGINTMIVFLCSGLWHGASWTFILWGGVHGCLMLLGRRCKHLTDRMPRWINQLVTLLCVNFAWVLFRAGSFTALRQAVSAMTRMDGKGLKEEIADCFIPVILRDVPCSGWVCAFVWLLGVGFVTLRCENVQTKAEKMKFSRISAVCCVLVAILSILSFSGVNTFVYSLF